VSENTLLDRTAGAPKERHLLSRKGRPSTHLEFEHRVYCWASDVRQEFPVPGSFDEGLDPLKEDDRFCVAQASRRANASVNGLRIVMDCLRPLLRQDVRLNSRQFAVATHCQQMRTTPHCESFRDRAVRLST
jgi:hypothetical protein